VSNKYNDIFEEAVYQELTDQEIIALEKENASIWQFVDDEMKPQDVVKEIRKYLAR
jgi:hypothetical protein